jgi:lipid-A-disaccharide synthase
MTETNSPAPFIFVITGEPSGDALGGALIAALRQRVGDGLRVAGIGGERMRQQGVDSLAPLSEFAVNGIAEVLPRAPTILRRIRQTIATIKQQKPDAVVTIDSSSFTWRIAHGLRRRGESLPLIHYVAPMVWVWRAGRARHIARWYDHLLCLLPFEPPYFEQAGLASSVVGHPVIESGAGSGDAGRFRAAHGIAPETMVLSVLPGSRGGEVRRLLPMFGAALREVEKAVGPFRVAIPTVETVADQVALGVRDWPGDPIVVRGDQQKYDAFAASRAALAASGTVALELAMARLPMTIAYRLNPITEFLANRVFKIGNVNLINLILGKTLVTEYVRGDRSPVRIAATLVELIRDDRVRAAHLDGYDQAIRHLGSDDLSPSLKAADKILEIIATRRQLQVH